MSTPPALVIAGPGTNRDRDLALALEVAGADPTIVLAAELAEHPHLLHEARLLAIAGGFSYGDALTDFVATGRPVIGICNGFQVLTRTKLLPGALGHNAHGRFECRWVVLEPQRSSRCLWTKGIEEPIHCPIAHGEGRYVHPDPDALAEGGMIALTYRSTNPNGSVADIAGVCNPAGNVLGLMPHPENFIVGRQHPGFRRGAGADHMGLQLFSNGVAAAAEM